MKTIAIVRPEDPEGQALWDEAKRNILVRKARSLAQIVADANREHIACLCGKRIDCACRMRLPSVDESGEDEGDE